MSVSDNSTDPGDSAPPDQSDGPSKNYRAPRTNLLLSGTIEAGNIRSPVRIRSLSETGAALEGAALPMPGERLILRRLDLEIGATVIWVANSRCGVQFEGSISVAGWRAGTWIASTTTSGQARVDLVQAAVRTGTQPTASVTEQPDDTATIGEVDTKIAAELIALRDMLEDMADQLSEVPTLLDHYAPTLQKFDIGCQVLGHLATVLSANNRALAIDAIGMDELRVRLRRKAKSHQ